MNENPDSPLSPEAERAAELVAEEGGSEEAAEDRYEDGETGDADSSGHDAPVMHPSEPAPEAARPTETSDGLDDTQDGLAEGPTGPLAPENTGQGDGDAGPQ